MAWTHLGLEDAAAARRYFFEAFGHTPSSRGRELIDRARASLTAKDVIRATEAGRGLTIAETLELARPGEPAPA